MRGKSSGELHGYAMIHDRAARTLEWRDGRRDDQAPREVEDLGPAIW
jgi:hypothetical protein